MTIDELMNDRVSNSHMTEDAIAEEASAIIMPVYSGCEEEPVSADDIVRSSKAFVDLLASKDLVDAVKYGLQVVQVKVKNLGILSILII